MKPTIFFLFLFTLSLFCMTCSGAAAGPPVFTLAAPAVESAAIIPVSAVAVSGCESGVCLAGPRAIVAAPVRAARAVAAVQPLRRVARVAVAVRPVRRVAAIVREVRPARRVAVGVGRLLFRRC